MYKRTMVISADEKKVLLARLEKARETKAAKAAAAKAAKPTKETLADVKEPEPPAPIPVEEKPPAPIPVEEKPPASEPIDIPAVPDLVSASKKKPAKKKRVETSDDDSDDSDSAVLPPKKGTGKKQAYMKIKIYKEPKNAAAFQSLIEAVQDEQPEEPVPEEPAPVSASASIGRSCRFANANANNMAMKKGTGVISAQELMRRAAMEFFS
jgi:hypothetical protein